MCQPWICSISFLIFFHVFGWSFKGHILVPVSNTNTSGKKMNSQSNIVIENIDKTRRVKMEVLSQKHFYPTIRNSQAIPQAPFQNLYHENDVASSPT